MEIEPQKQPGTHYKYNDVRVNVLAYSLLQVFRESLPKVLKNTIMDQLMHQILGDGLVMKIHG